MIRWLLCALGLVLLPAGNVSSAGAILTAYDVPRSAPAFALPATDGTIRRLEDFSGRYLLVNFWAVWCAPCRREMPSMQRAYEQLRDHGVDMVAIHVGPDQETARGYAEQLDLGFTILVDEDMALSDWQVAGLPTTFLLDRSGRIVAKAVGEREWDKPAVLDRIRLLSQAD